jgi:hypothetical protein
MAKILTTSQIESAKNEAFQKQLIRKRVQVEDLNFVTSDTIEYCGLFLGLDKKALRDLTNYLGISEKLERTMNSVIGEEFTKTLINTLKNAISSKKGNELTMVIDRNRNIKRFISEANSMLSTSAFFEQVDRVMNDSNLDIERFTSDDDGNISISTISQSSDFGIKGLKDEYFKSGLNMSNSITGVKVDPYIHRLICTNGMIGRAFDESVNIKKFDKKNFEKLHESIKRIRGNGFQPQSFTDQVKKAIDTPASVSELLQGIDLIKSNSKIPDDQVRLFVDYNKTFRDYAKLGVEVEKLNHAQQRNAKTDVSMWNLINGMTDFASHNYGYDVKEGSIEKIQMQAGNMLTKVYDTSNLVPVQPY